MKTFLLLLLFGPDVRDLAHDDWNVRERAEARLSRWADVAYPLLDRPFADVEQRRRARRVVGRVLPPCYPPLALLAGSPLPEWSNREDPTRCVMGPPPDWGGPWRLAYLRPDTSAPLAWVVRRYGEEARTEFLWKEWQTDADGREATRLFCRDLLAMGCPPCLMRALVRQLEAKERALHYIGGDALGRWQR